MTTPTTINFRISILGFDLQISELKSEAEARKSKPFIHSLLVTSIALFFLSTPVFAGFFAGEGGTAFPFLKIPMNARANALGGAFTAEDGDITAIEYNPAGLNRIEQNEVNLSYISHIEDTSLQSAAFGFPIKDQRSPRLRKKNLGSVKETKAFAGFEYRIFQADDDQRNEIGVKTGDLDFRDQMARAAISYQLYSKFIVGLAGKYITSKIQNESASTFAGDVGALWKPRRDFSIGGSILNLGSEVSYIRENDPLPTQFRGGARYTTGRFLFLGDVSHGRDEITQFSTGLEVNIHHILYLRGGAIHNTQIEGTGGIGIRLTPQKRSTGTSGPQKPPLRANPIKIGLDYAIQTRNEFGVSHSVTLKVMF